MQRWRLIKDRQAIGAVNMATDEALVRALDEGVSSLPVLRVYGWSEPTISIGYMQDGAPFLSSGLPVVRRITGGRAVLHSAEVTYSVIAPNDSPLFSEGILKTYQVISECIVAALKRSGVAADMYRGGRKGLHRNDACFLAPSRFEVMACGKKLVGSSQRRFKRAFLQHGSIIFKVDEEANTRVFGREATDGTASVRSFSDVSEDAFLRTLVDEFASGLNACFEEETLRPAEERMRDAILLNGYQAIARIHSDAAKDSVLCRTF